LGEGWGEGLADQQETKTLLYLFPVRSDKKGEEVFLGFVAEPSPRPTPKGRGLPTDSCHSVKNTGFSRSHPRLELSSFGLIEL